MRPPDAAGVVRVFYASVPPLPLRTALGELARDAARHAHGRPVSANDIHLTLAFVGNIAVARMPALLAVGAGLRAQPIPAQLDVQGGFLRAGVAWVAPSTPLPPLTDLALALRSALDAAGIAQEKRAFHPHLTLARGCRGPYAHTPVGPLAWNVDHVALMQSELRIERARYRLLARWPLVG